MHISVLHLCILPFVPHPDEAAMMPLETSLVINGLLYIVDELHLDVRSCGPQNLAHFFVKWNPRVFSMSMTDIAMPEVRLPDDLQLRLEFVHMPTFGGGVLDPICRIVSHCLAQNDRKLSCVRITSHMLLPAESLHTVLFDPITELCSKFNVELSFRCPFRRWTFDGLFESMLKVKTPCQKCRTLTTAYVCPFVENLEDQHAFVGKSNRYTPFYFETLCAGRPSTLVASYWSGFCKLFPLIEQSTVSSEIPSENIRA